MKQRAEIRKDYITSRYVIIATGRKHRPHQFTETAAVDPSTSPFTPARLAKKQILDSLGSGDRRIVAVKNKFPAVSPNNKKAYGFQEVIVETPDPTLRLADLSMAQIKDLFVMYQRRTRALLKKPRLNYILCFKNEGPEAGASISHAHSQVFATEVVPPRVIETREHLHEYKIEHGHSLYREIIAKEMKSRRRVFENRYLAVFCPYASAYENEVWIVTKREITSIALLNEAERNALAKALYRLLQPLKQINAPYNYFFHALKGSSAEHLCLRLQPRAHIWAGVELDSSMTVNWVAPEEAAKMYRKSF